MYFDECCLYTLKISIDKNENRWPHFIKRLSNKEVLEHDLKHSYLFCNRMNSFLPWNQMKWRLCCDFDVWKKAIISWYKNQKTKMNKNSIKLLNANEFDKSYKIVQKIKLRLYCHKHFYLTKFRNLIYHGDSLFP